MNLNITSPDQLVEFVARCLYLLSSYRYWQKDYDQEPSSEVKRILDRDRKRIDEFLATIGATEYQPLKEIMAQLKLQINLENEKDNSLVEGDS